MKGWNLILWVIILGTIGYVGWNVYKEGVVHKLSVTQKIENRDPTSDAYVYENKLSKYRVSIPSDWNISEAAGDTIFESRAEFTPVPDALLKAKAIDIDVLKKDKSGAELYSDADFNKFQSLRNDASINGITKIGQQTVSGETALLLADLSQQGTASSSGWTLLAWFKKDGRNFYVKMFGKYSIEDQDKQVFRYLLGTMELD